MGLDGFDQLVGQGRLAAPSTPSIATRTGCGRSTQAMNDAICSSMSVRFTALLGTVDGRRFHEIAMLVDCGSDKPEPLIELCCRVYFEDVQPDRDRSSPRDVEDVPDHDGADPLVPQLRSQGDVVQLEERFVVVQA